MLASPNHEPVERAPAGNYRINAEDSTELRWYFSDPQIAGVGTGSNMGIMLERAAIMAIALSPCNKCGGSRDDDRPGTGYCARIGGTYQKALDRYRKMEAKKLGLRLCADRAAADEWKRLGITKVATGEDIAQELPDHLTKRCQKCEGTGMVQRRRNNRSGPQTVKATGSSVNGNPDAMHWVDEAALARFASVGRKLDRVATVSPLARACLGAYYAPGGGSIGSLWRLTEEGQRFLRVTPNPQEVAPDQLMQNEREHNREHPMAERTVMFSKIAQQSAELWDQACRTWNEAAR
jgi:hypothetical protein